MANIDVATTSGNEGGATAAGEAGALLNQSLVATTAVYTVPTARYLALSSTTPILGTAFGTEVTAGNGRQAITFGAPTLVSGNASVTTVTTAQSFTNMPAATVNGVEIYTTSTVQTRRLWYGALTAPKTTASGDSLTFAIGAITATLA